MQFNRHTGTIKVEIWNGHSGRWHYNVMDIFATSVAHGECRQRREAENVARAKSREYRQALKKNS